MLTLEQQRRERLVYYAAKAMPYVAYDGLAHEIAERAFNIAEAMLAEEERRCAAQPEVKK